MKIIGVTVCGFLLGKSLIDLLKTNQIPIKDLSGVIIENTHTYDISGIAMTFFGFTAFGLLI